jgi:hypothetical protein
LSQSSIWCCFFSFSGNLNQLRRECNLINSIFSPFLLLFFQYLLFVMYFWILGSLYLYFSKEI